MNTFADRVDAAVRETGTPLALGLDPTPECLPPELSPETRERIAWIDAYREFSFRTLEACRPHTGITKIQIAFFEVLGPAGTALFWECCARARALDYVVIADVKRNDIGHTAQAYARAFLDPSTLPWESTESVPDAITVTPLFGDDGNRPFLDAAETQGRGVFFLVRTSNPSSEQLQSLRLHDGTTFDHATARLIASYASVQKTSPGNPYGSVGAVVGATHPGALASFRSLLPGVLLLLPGVGAQGADSKALRPAFDEEGRGAIVPVSRGILSAHAEAKRGTANWASALESAASNFARDLSTLLRS